MKRVELIADGSCLSNPGPGGWACILRYGKRERVLQGAAPVTTNNQMELLAVTMGLRALREPCEVEVVTDCRYVWDGMTRLLGQWERAGWRNSRGLILPNRRLWSRLKEAAKQHRITWRWVRGHGTDQQHNRCDRLARAMSYSLLDAAARGTRQNGS